MDKNLRPYLAEMVGTFILVFVSAGAVCMNAVAAVAWQSGQPAGVQGGVIVQPQPGLVGIAVAAGLVYAAILAVTAYYSEGFLNPAVTLMLWVFKRLDGGKTALLIAVQFIGAAAAGGLLRAVFATNDLALSAARLGTPHMNTGAFGGQGPSFLMGIALEAVLSFALTFVIFATVLDPRAPRYLGRAGRWLSPLWIGLALTALVIVGFNYTGASLNPARWFGPAVWQLTISSLVNDRPLGDHVVFWAGPVVGALVAGALYHYLILPAEETRPAATAPHPKAAAPALSRSRK